MATLLWGLNLYSKTLGEVVVCYGTIYKIKKKGINSVIVHIFACINDLRFSVIEVILHLYKVFIVSLLLYNGVMYFTDSQTRLAD